MNTTKTSDDRKEQKRTEDTSLKLMCFPKEVIMYADKMGSTLPWAKLSMAESGTRHYSLMPWHMAHHGSAVRAFVGNTKITSILDMTAHAGMDTIQLAQIFRDAKINAIEIKTNISAVLKHNMQMAQIAHRVHVHCPQNAMDYLFREDARADLIYVDAPWDLYDGDLYLEDGNEQLWNMADILHYLFSRKITSLVVIKMPPDPYKGKSCRTADAFTKKWNGVRFDVHNMTRVNPLAFGERVSYNLWCFRAK